MKDTPPLKGAFSPGEETLPRLLMQLHTSGLTGALVVQSGSITKKLYLKKGEAVFASSDSRDDWLGVALVKAGKITLQQFEHSAEFMKKSGKRHGAVLVELGYITPKELFWAVKFQVREIIYSMFEYDRAGYEFLEGGIPEEVITLMMSMGSLIYEGVGRIDNLIRIKEELPPTWTVLQLNDDPLRLFQGVQFSAKDRRILSLVDGKRMIKQVIEDSCLNSFEAMKIIYVFWAIGILTGKQKEKENISVEVLFLKPYDDGKDAFEARVAAMLERLPEMGPREVLGVSETAGLAEIKNSYYRLAREFHPDRVFDSEDQHLRDKIVDIFGAVKRAYLTLTAELPAPSSGPAGLQEPAGPSGLTAGREETDCLVEADGPGPGPHASGLTGSDGAPFNLQVNPEGPNPDWPAASGQTGSGSPGESAAMAANDPMGPDSTGPALPKPEIGIDSLRVAVSLDPSNPEGWRLLAIALSEAGGPDPMGPSAEAEEAMQTAIGLDPLDSGCYLDLGLIYLKGGRIEEARRQFEKSLVLDPENRKAREQLGRLEG
ncbi:MAG: DnaJ domain-containing protein [Nitrospiraceae bacterium]|nr:DnaJ domain-containing protein [Nitrospiraceae bacterium]